MSEAFDAGAEAGRDIKKLAVDCPHLPTDTSGQRDDWLAGFSSTRSEVSPSSNPKHAAGAQAPEEPAIARGNTPHAG